MRRAAMLRFRITMTEPDGREQTWVLLPDGQSAFTQAEELARQNRRLRVRVYREETGREPVLELDLPGREG